MGSNDPGRKIPGGYVLLARSIRDSGIWTLDADHVRLWVYLLLEARWDTRPKKYGDVTVGRGQVLKSYRKIAKENEYMNNRQLQVWSTSRVKRMVERLVKAGMITVLDTIELGTDLGTLFTIQNFNVYQDPERYRLEPGTGLGTTAEQPRNDRKKEKKDKNPTAPVGSLDFDFSKEMERLATHASEHLHLNGKPTSQDRDIIREWLIKGIPPEQIEGVITGLRLAIDAGKIGFISKGMEAGCAALNGPKWDGRTLWSIAEDFYWKQEPRQVVAVQ